MIPIAKPVIGDEECAAVDRVLRSGQLAQGPEVAAFEDEFSATVENRHCIAVNSGTSALHLALLAIGVGVGDEVIVPSFSFAATANAVALTGARPVFVDIEPQTYCLDPAGVAAAIGPATRAILPVHLYGHPADMSRLAELAVDHKLRLVEDAAQAHCAAWDGTAVGAFGDVAAFSFYPTKNMTTGEGGMVVTGSEEAAEQVRLLRSQGMRRRYENEIVGFNNRMSDLHAAIGRVQLTRLPELTKKRQQNAAFLSTHLEGVETPATEAKATHVFHQYTVRVAEDRDGFAEELARRGVQSGVYYPIPIHRLPSFLEQLDLPETERAAAHVLSLPVHPLLSEQELEEIVTTVNHVARAGA